MSSVLSAMFNPKRIAVIGAAQDPMQLRGRFLHNLKRSGFKGEVFPVHPKHTEIQGLKAYPNIASIPGSVDLAMIAVPSDSLVSVLAECGDAGAKGAVVYSGIPFGPEGKKMQAEVTRIAREKKIRVLGPNCLGFFKPFSSLAATFSPLDAFQFVGQAPSQKRVAIISQSGGTGLHIFEQCTRAGLNIVQVMMPGNEADIDVVELLEHAIDAKEVDLVLMYVEGFNDGRRFIQAAEKAAAAAIPIVMLKIGKTKAGTRAAVSHTAHLTGSDTSYEAVFHRYGITRVYDPEAMVALATVMARRVFMKGSNVGVVSNGGGYGSICADLCEANGLPVPPLGEALRSELATFIPAHGSTDNPIDTAGALDDHGVKFCKSIQHVLASDDINAVVAMTHFGLPDVSGAMLPYLTEFSRNTQKPIVLSSSSTPTEENLKALAELGFTVLPLAAAVQSTRALDIYSQFLRRREAALKSKPAAPRKPLAAAGDLSDRNRQIALLKHYDVPLPAEALAKDEESACAHAKAIGYPLVLKIESPDIPHKTEAGGVKLNIRDEQGVREAFRAIMASAKAYAPKARLDGVLLQKMAPPGRELIVGMVADEDFGPLLMLGFGGTFAEILKDVVFSPLPVDETTANDMISRLRGLEILKGARGQKPADLAAVTRLLVNLSQMIEANPSITQLDLNPVVVYPEGEGICVVDTLLVTQGKDAPAAAKH